MRYRLSLLVGPRVRKLYCVAVPVFMDEGRPSSLYVFIACCPNAIGENTVEVTIYDRQGNRVWGTREVIYHPLIDNATYGDIMEVWRIFTEYPHRPWRAREAVQHLILYYSRRPPPGILKFDLSVYEIALPPLRKGDYRICVKTWLYDRWYSFVDECVEAHVGLPSYGYRYRFLMGSEPIIPKYILDITRWFLTWAAPRPEQLIRPFLRLRP